MCNIKISMEWSETRARCWMTYMCLRQEVLEDGVKCLVLHVFDWLVLEFKS